VKREGGIAIVQHPEDSQHPGMPQSALQNVEVDHILRVHEIAPLLNRLAQEHVKQAVPHRPKGLLGDEETIATMDSNAMEQDEHPGNPSVYSCPECKGTLWEIQENQLLRFRCRVGHAYTAEALALDQHENLERALWVAFRALEENVSLLERLAERARGLGDDQVAEAHEEEAEHKRQSASLMGDLLVRTQ
jgi:two-component system chemotaxis response regulator CheB